METLELEKVEISDYELDRGKPMPSKLHAITQKRFLRFIDVNFDTKCEILPELRISINERDFVPDLCIYPKFENIDWVHDEIKMTKMPLATIEILSPKQNLDELIEKTETYFLAGVESCWIVLPTLKAVIVYFQFGKYSFFSQEDVLKDNNLNIEIPLKEIFR